MKLRLNIGLKLSLGFAFLTLTFLSFSWFTHQRLQRSKEITNNITEVYLASEAKLNELYILIGNSKMLIKNWVYIDQIDDTPDKKKLKTLINIEVPQLIDEIHNIKLNWEKEDQEYFNALNLYITDSLFVHHKAIMSQLNSFDSYQDEMAVWMLKFEYFDGSDSKVNKFTRQAEQKLDYLKTIMSDQTKAATEEMNNDFDNFQKLILFLASFLFILAMLTAIFSVRMILLPIIKVKKALYQLSEGVIGEDINSQRKDEIGEMLRALDKMKKGFQKSVHFAIEMGRKNYTTNFTPLSEHDELGNSLITLRDNLAQAQTEAEARKQQDFIQNWITQGVAKFAELLRSHNNEIEEMSKTILSNLVKYLEINQGGIYIHKKENFKDQYLELTAMYAYNKEKYRKNRIMPGEGLVGVCFLEKRVVLLKEVPKDYISITSGMGQAPPQNILIAPLSVNNEALGVIELASFTEFKEHQIHFVEQISESIAATISNIKINNETQSLLVKSNEQAELMRAQEEEMRQNLEELQTTQEEFNRKRKELESEIKNIHKENETLKQRLAPRA